MKEEDFCGVILGGDMNSYAVARAFYEAYKIKTIVIGRFPLYPTRFSKLIIGYYYKDLLDENVMLKAFEDIDKLYLNKKKIVLSNTDYYVEQVIKNRDKILSISDNFIVPTIDYSLFNKLFHKDSFYKLCDEMNLEYPKTVVFDFEKDDIKSFDIPFEYPIFMKPANTDLYTRLDFKGRQKGYKINNREEFDNNIDIIKKGGYKDKFIVQEYIEAIDDDMYVYTFYANKNHEVEVFTGGKILMHDRSPELIGNYNAITNAYDEKLCLVLKKFVEDIKYTGIGHFDIVFDRKRNKYLVFEINIRQGRSNMYTLASGVNLMEYIVNDYIKDVHSKFRIADREFTVSLVSKRNLLKYVKNHKIKNFYRFTLCKYDFNFKRLYFQYKWDKKILNGFKKYNK